MSRKVLILVIGGLLSVAFAILAYFSTSSFWQGLLINASTVFLGVVVAVICVEIYLERGKRKDAVIPLFLLSNASIARFHNTFIELVTTVFGWPDWKKLLEQFIEEKGSPNSIRPEDRNRIYNIVKDNIKQLNKLVENLDKSLKELIMIVGWDLDIDLLNLALNARLSIREFQELELDDSEETKKRICKYLIDIDLMTHSIRERLKEMGGIQEIDEVLSNLLNVS